MSVNAQPALFGVVGFPVKHSMSPKIHQYWYDQLSVNARYLALELIDYVATSDIEALARAGFSGLNVTLPHKLSALEAAGGLTDAAQKIGAVNTLTRIGDENEFPVWSGDNTDWSGFLWALDRICETLPDDALLIGAGGAARAVAYALKSRGIRVTILNRTLEKADELINDIGLVDARIAALNTLDRQAENYDLIINTISLGHSGGQLQLPEKKNGLFFDISYGDAAAEGLKAAQSVGWYVEDGLAMLVGQAADAFKTWFDIEPDREGALKMCRDLISAE